MAQNVKIGTYEGTGAAINIELGFVPEYVRVVNAEDGDAAWEWFAGMTDGHAIAYNAIEDDGTTGNAAIAPITSNGVSDLVGDRTTPLRPGFTVGTALSESGKTFRYIAMRSSHD
jgi:hypothetical protein